ncbi:baseplate wedge subunit and tail pin [Klebsiella phage CPRSB]|nr:baseplate wedge subunit and tail pin [Klebsiella phage CPRSB]
MPWKTFAGTTLSPKFGESWALNTSANKITVNLPKGGVGDYNKVIRLRDVWSRWATNNVRLIPQLVILSKVPQLLKICLKILWMWNWCIVLRPLGIRRKQTD